MNRVAIIRWLHVAVVTAGAGIAVFVTGTLAHEAYSITRVNSRVAEALAEPFVTGPLNLAPYVVPTGSEQSSVAGRQVIMLVDDHCEPCDAVTQRVWLPLLRQLSSADVSLAFITAGSMASVGTLVKTAEEAGLRYRTMRIVDVPLFALGTGLAAVPATVVLDSAHRVRLLVEGEPPLPPPGLLEAVLKSDRPLVIRSTSGVRSLGAVHGIGAGERCVTYRSSELSIEDLGPSGYALQAGSERLHLLDNRSDATRAMIIARAHMAKCSLFNGEQAVMEYWKRLPSVEDFPAVEGPEDCVPYEANELEVSRDGPRWVLRTGKRILGGFDTEATAYLAHRIASDNTAHCFVGRRNARPERSAYILEYWR